LLRHLQFADIVTSQGTDSDPDPVSTVLWSLTEDGSLLTPNDPNLFEWILRWELGPTMTLSDLPKILAATIRNPSEEYDTLFMLLMDRQGVQRMDPFGWMQMPAQNSVFETFNKAMSSYSNIELSSLIEFYGDRLSQIHTLVDVGGSLGTLVGRILQAYPSIRSGVVADLGPVVQMAEQAGELKRFGVADRTRLVPMDFFDPSTLPVIVPQEAVAANAEWGLIMKHVLHDWADAKALVILENLSTAIRSVPNAAAKCTLCIVEHNILPASHPAAPAVNWMASGIDMHMMLATGGMQRNMQQWEMLFKQTGWKLRRIAAGELHVSVVEATLA